MSNIAPKITRPDGGPRIARWILLRGLVRETGHWGGFVEQFQSAFPGDTVTALDLPGAGECRGGICPRTMHEIWRDVRERADVSKGPIRLFAVSLGAMVGMEWLRSAPDELELCVFVNSSTRVSGPFYKRMRWQIWQNLVRMLAIRKPRERERALMEILMNNVAAREVALPQWTKIALERPVSPQNLLFQLAAAAQFKGLDALPEGKRVLLLAGLGDRLVDPSNSEELARLWNCPIKHHPWAGHDLTWDDPEWTIKAISEWLG